MEHSLALGSRQINRSLVQQAFLTQANDLPLLLQQHDGAGELIVGDGQVQGRLVVGIQEIGIDVTLRKQGHHSRQTQLATQIPCRNIQGQTLQMKPS